MNGDGSFLKTIVVSIFVLFFIKKFRPFDFIFALRCGFLRKLLRIFLSCPAIKSFNRSCLQGYRQQMLCRRKQEIQGGRASGKERGEGGRERGVKGIRQRAERREHILIKLIFHRGAITGNQKNPTSPPFPKGGI
jgi:hypothetical protein